MSIKLRVEAGAIGRNLQAKGFGFDPISIITIVLGLWQQCQQKADPNANPAEVLRGRMTDGKFNQDLLDEARHNAKRANRIAFRRGESPKRHLSDEELDQISTAAFAHVIEADDEVVSTCAKEASEMTFDDEDGAE